MAYMLDTSVAIHLRDQDPAIRTKIESLSDPILISVVTVVELEGGVYRDPQGAARRRARLDAMMAAIPQIAFDAKAAAQYGVIVAQLGYSRRLILDRMIAAQSIVHGATLVTRNSADFAGIAGLSLEQW
jgi:predicted nucleic acid-binding protein